MIFFLFDADQQRKPLSSTSTSLLRFNLFYFFQKAPRQCSLSRRPLARPSRRVPRAAHRAGELERELWSSKGGRPREKKNQREREISIGKLAPCFGASSFFLTPIAFPPAPLQLHSSVAARSPAARESLRVQVREKQDLIIGTKRQRERVRRERS